MSDQIGMQDNTTASVNDELIKNITNNLTFSCMN